MKWIYENSYTEYIERNIFSIYGYITNSQSDQLPVGKSIPLVLQRSWVWIPFKSEFFQTLFSQPIILSVITVIIFHLLKICLFASIIPEKNSWEDCKNISNHNTFLNSIQVSRYHACVGSRHPCSPYQCVSLTLQSCMSEVASSSTLNRGEEGKNNNIKAHFPNTLVWGCSYYAECTLNQTSLVTEMSLKRWMLRRGFYYLEGVKILSYIGNLISLWQGRKCWSYLLLYKNRENFLWSEKCQFQSKRNNI